MNREFVLRDNEIAINRPDGTVVIMNLEAYKALRDEKPNAEYQKIIDNLRSLLAKRDDQLKTAKTIQAGYEFQTEELQKKLQKAEEEKKVLTAKVKHAEDNLDMQQKEIFNMKKDRDLFVLKIAELTKENEALKNQNKVTKQLVLWGSTKIPKNIPDFMYVTSNGEVFFSGAEIERKYNLPKGSVSSYFADKQKFLYPRDSNGVYAVDEVSGDIERLTVVRRFTNSMFKNKDLNYPDISLINEAIKTAKMFKNGELQ